jgi:protein involved in polysaccharide export with SLBB domain
MGIRAFPTALAGIAVWFLGLTATTAQRQPRCTAVVPTPESAEALALFGQSDPAQVTIAGEVTHPCMVDYSEGMTLADLIDHAGRLKRTADLTLEVYRVLKNGSEVALAVPEIHSIRVDSAYLMDHNADKIYASYIPGFTVLVDRAAAFKMRPYDRVVVRPVIDLRTVLVMREGT